MPAVGSSLRGRALCVLCDLDVAEQRLGLGQLGERRGVDTVLLRRHDHAAQDVLVHLIS